MRRLPGGLRQVLLRCSRPRHLRRTLLIAFLVGSWLTLFNQGGEILASGIGPGMALKVLLNYLTPFVVANLGLVSAEDGRGGRQGP